MTNATQLIRALAVSLALVPAGAFAQQGYPPQYAPSKQYATQFKPGVELVGLVGYHVASDLNYFSGHAGIDGSVSYGATLRAKVRPEQTVELMWIWAPTNAHFFTNPGAVGSFGSGDASLNIHYFQIGGVQSFRSDRVEPYFGATAGAALYSLGDLKVSGTPLLTGSDIWRFAFTLGGGLKVWLAEKVALQFDARMLAPVWFSSGSVYVGGGGGAYAVSGGIPIVEGNFTGGIVIAP